MEWNALLNAARRKDKAGKASSSAAGREEIERDFDRILFLAPTRRLADKTQVFPLEQNDSVRTRLTHSYEVSNLARGIGTRLVFDYREEIFSGYENDGARLERSVPSLLAAIGLAHDLGNPPFGHEGESAIRHWFKQKEKEKLTFHSDFLSFDGNSQTIRLLTRLQILNDKFGINLTYASLAALLKYPQSSQAVKGAEGNESKSLTWKKHGFFESEKDIVDEVWKKTGLISGVRHPLTYIMEACDDIAYSVLDAEDIVKKGLASFSDLMNHLSQFVERRNSCVQESRKEAHEDQNRLIESLIERAKGKHAEYSTENLSPSELNDVSMQMMRVYAIGDLVDAVTAAFVEHYQYFIDQDTLPKDLMSLSRGDALCLALKDFDKKWGYRNKSVLKLELEGYNYIHELMDMLWVGIHGRLEEEHDSQSPFGKYAYERIYQNSLETTGFTWA